MLLNPYSCVLYVWQPHYRRSKFQLPHTIHLTGYLDPRAKIAPSLGEIARYVAGTAVVAEVVAGAVAAAGAASVL